MKLESIEVIVTANPPPSFGGRYFIFVKVTTKCGIVGWGECYAASVGPKAMVHVIEDVFYRHCAKESPENIERMFRKVYSSGFTQRPDPTSIGAFSGIEMACWDIIGKARNRPVWALLGGKICDRLRSYTYLYPNPQQDASKFYHNADQSAQAAAIAVEQGFTALKFDPAGAYTIHSGHMPSLEELDRSEMFCKKIREAVGNRADLLFGTHGQFSTAGALRLAQRIEKYDPLWFEEPCPPDQFGSIEQLSGVIKTPIATGERLVSKTEFSQALRAGATILQPALGRAGGIFEVKKIAAIAEVYNAQIAPHLYAGPIEFLANAQLAASIPNFLMLETIQTGGDFHNKLLSKPINWEDGHIILSEEAGLGADLNEDFAKSHPYEEDFLHLEMQSGYKMVDD